LIIFNLVGLAMVGIGLGAAFLVGFLAGTTNEDALMLVLGPVVFVCDVVYRLKHRRPTDASQWLYHPRRGGQLFFCPLWALGLFWMLLGTYRLVQSA
jgi:hypothetical protein